MNIENYTSFSPFRLSIISENKPLSKRFIEKILLFLIATVGVIGSFYVFNMNNGGGSNPNFQNISLLAASTTVYDSIMADDEEKFKDYFKISGKKKVGEVLMFKFKQDRNTSRYVIDMGNGERVIVTSDEFPYAYNEAGEYKLELKTINRGLITTVASTTIKIKD